MGAVVAAFNGGGAAVVAIDWLDNGGTAEEEDLFGAIDAGICWFVIGGCDCGGIDIGFTAAAVAAPIVGGGSCGGTAVDAGTFEGAYMFGRWFDIGVSVGGK